MEAGVEIGRDFPATGGEFNDMVGEIVEVEFVGGGSGFKGAEVDVFVAFVVEGNGVEVADELAKLGGTGEEAFVGAGESDPGVEGFRGDGDGVACGEEGVGLAV